jgi:hypothetical protein
MHRSEYRLPAREARRIGQRYGATVPPGLMVKVFPESPPMSMDWFLVRWSRRKEAA